jgi:hypothetical protein
MLALKSSAGVDPPEELKFPETVPPSVIAFSLLI